jgi:hypothetical protein
MPRCNLTEQEIIDGLRDETRRDGTARMLYYDDEVRNAVFGYVINRGGDKEKAVRVFNYAFETFDRHVRQGKYPQREGENNWRRYLSNIGYNAWDWKSYDRSPTEHFVFESLENAYDIGIEPLNEMEEVEFWEKIKVMLEACGVWCYRIFKMAAEGYSDREITEQMRIDEPVLNEATLRQRKTSCRRRFMELFGNRRSLTQ